MSAHTRGPWELRTGFSDWNLPGEHNITAGETDIAAVPFITPSPIGASQRDRDAYTKQVANAQLIVCAPDMVDVLIEIRDHLYDKQDWGRAMELAGDVLKKAGVIE